MLSEVIVQLTTRFDPATGTLDGIQPMERRLSDLRGVFADEVAYNAALAQGDPLIYHVASVEQASGEGQLHYGVGTLMPGRVGSEYYMTKGHFHAWRQAAELYIGLHGEGALLLEAEDGQASTLIPLVANRAIYVPGSTAHRTVNTGRVPLVYLGVYPADAGHDYGAVASRNFRSVVVEVDGEATQMDRGTYIASLTPGHR